MNNIRIQDLSDIEERKPTEDSFINFPKNKKQPNINCPINNQENYDCPICNRLRDVCPWSKLNRCKHTSSFFSNKNDISWNSKGNNSTTINDRLKTFSTIQSRKNPQNVFVSPSRTNMSETRHLSEGRLKTQVGMPQTEEIIFYPIVHNKLVQNAATPTRTPSETPTRRKKDVGYVRKDVILTPTQFKELLEAVRFN